MSQPRGRKSMLARRLPGRDPGQAECGSLTLMLIVVFVALVALAGIVIDGGAKLTAAENAAAIAQEAARAGAGMVNRDTAYAKGNFVVDEDQATEAADQYLATAAAIPGSGVTGSAAPALGGQDSIEVTVTIIRPTKVLSIIGIDSITVTGHAVAMLESGVTGPGQ